MLRFRYVAIAAVSLLYCAGVSLAQTGDDNGTLYFPPKLTVSYQFGGREPILSITESFSPTSAVLLPVIFFDHPGDWTIPSRYQIFSGTFAARDYADTNPVRVWDPMEKYREILNIVGFRMREHPGTRIRLQGGYSTEPGENGEVADARAEIVKEYLTNVWHIEPERIALLPSQRMCDSTEHLFRQQEARRVTFLSDDWELLKPVKYSISIRSIGSLYMRFTIDPYAPAEEVREIEFVMTAGDKVIGQASIPGHPDSTVYRPMAMWWMNGSQRDPDGGLFRDVEFSSVAVEARVHLRDGRIRRSNTELIGVQTQRYESEGDVNGMPNSLTLPFFQYRDSTLTDYHRMLIREFVSHQRFEGPVAMDLMGRADASEDPEVDPSTLSDYWMEVQDMEYEEAPPHAGQLMVWSRVDERSYYNDMEVEEGTYISEEIANEEFPDSSDVASNDRFTSDSLAMARTRVVERYFRDSLSIALYTFDQLPGRDRGIASTYEYTPEARWLARSVVLVVHPYSRYAEQEKWMTKELERRAAARE